MQEGQTYDIKKGTKFYYYGHLAIYTYFSVKYKTYHFSNYICPNNQLDDMAKVMANQEYHKNWVLVKTKEELEAEANGTCLF